MILYGELTKLEPQADGSIRVQGVASSGARDMAGEIVSPEAMRQALPAYLAFGAIREMHQPRAAGAALCAEVGADGATRISAHIVDPVAVKKVQAGVYKGLSIGGKVLGRDPADPSVITALRLDEISLVDRPCNPEAVIDLWKAQTPPTNAEVKAEAERLARAAGKPDRRNDYLAKAREGLMRGASFDAAASPPARDERGGEGPHDTPDGDVGGAPHGSYADPLQAKYPLDTPERIRAAWAAIASPQNRAAYGSDAVAALEARIAAAWRVKIDPDGPPSSGPSPSSPSPFGPSSFGPSPSAPPSPAAPDLQPKGQGAYDLQKLDALEQALSAARADAQALARRLDDQGAEIERLKRQPTPPRTAGAHLAKAVDKVEDGPDRGCLAPGDIARALDAMAPAERAHLLMKAALARPIPL